MRSGILISRPYAVLWAAQVGSEFGNYVARTTLVLWAATTVTAGEPWAPAAVGGLLVCEGISAALGPVAGVWVDRHDRVTIMTRIEALRTVVAAGFAGLTVVPLPAIPTWGWLTAVYAVVAVLSGAEQFYAPAMFAVIPELAPGPDERARAARLTEAIPAPAGILGPILAATLVVAGGIQSAMAVNAATFFVSCLACRALKGAVSISPPAPRRSSLLAELTEGARAFAAHPYLRPLITVTLPSQVGTAALYALNVWFISGDLGQPARGYALAQVAMGCGFAVGAAAAGRVAKRAGVRTVTWTGLAAAGLLTLTYAGLRDWAAGIIVLCLYGAVIAVLTTATAPALMDGVPKRTRARVVSLYWAMNQTASAASIMVWAWLASNGAHDVRLLLAVSSGIIALAAVHAYKSLPALPRPTPVAAGGRLDGGQVGGSGPAG
jgi:MFS family permease